MTTYTETEEQLYAGIVICGECGEEQKWCDKCDVYHHIDGYDQEHENIKE